MSDKSQKGRHTGMKDQMVMGIPVDDLISGAMVWYDLKGRHILKNRQFSGDMKQQQDCLDATNPVHPNYIGGHSNIMLGQSWDMLTPKEKYRVVKAYTLTIKEMEETE